jgi:Family of unknown function (DUF6252)
MKQILIQSFLVATMLLNGCSSKKSTPVAASTGSASAKFNGTTWTAEYAGALTASFSGKESLTIVSSLTSKDNSENLSIGLQPFTGVGTYSYDDKNKSAILLRINYKSKTYSINQSAAGSGSGTIKITEYVDAKGILNPGKVVGEFSGTIKSATSTDMLTITNGKFTAVKVL